MKDRHCKRGHFRPASDRRHQCLECRRPYFVAYRKTEARRITKRNSSRRRRGSGVEHQGLTKSVLQAVGREKITEAFEMVARTGRMADAYPVIGSGSRWQALRFFYPKLGATMDKILANAKAERQAQIIRPAGPAIIRRVDATFLQRLNEAVGRHLARDHRQDVMADMVEAFMRRTLSEADIERRASEFVNARYKTDHDKWGDASLDMPAFRDSETPLGATIERGLWTGHTLPRATKSSNGVWR